MMFIDIRTGLKARLPTKLLKMQAQLLYSEWLKENPTPEKNQLKFSDRWVKGWCEEFNVSVVQSQ